MVFQGPFQSLTFCGSVCISTSWCWWEPCSTTSKIWPWSPGFCAQRMPMTHNMTLHLHTRDRVQPLGVEKISQGITNQDGTAGPKGSGSFPSLLPPTEGQWLWICWSLDSTAPHLVKMSLTSTQPSLCCFYYIRWKTYFELSWWGSRPWANPLA